VFSLFAHQAFCFVFSPFWTRCRTSVSFCEL
jgi:hypothetical protein